MTKATAEKLNDFPYVKKELSKIPRKLWSLFLPNDDDGLLFWEFNIQAWKNKSKDRRQAYNAWRHYKLPLKYRKLSYREIWVKCKIIDMKKKRREGGDESSP